MNIIRIGCEVFLKIRNLQSHLSNMVFVGNEPRLKKICVVQKRRYCFFIPSWTQYGGPEADDRWHGRRSASATFKFSCQCSMKYRYACLYLKQLIYLRIHQQDILTRVPPRPQDASASSQQCFAKVETTTVHLYKLPPSKIGCQWRFHLCLTGHICDSVPLRRHIPPFNMSAMQKTFMFFQRSIDNG